MQYENMDDRMLNLTGSKATSWQQAMGMTDIPVDLWELVHAEIYPQFLPIGSEASAAVERVVEAIGSTAQKQVVLNPEHPFFFLLRDAFSRAGHRVFCIHIEKRYIYPHIGGRLLERRDGLSEPSFVEVTQ